MSFAASHPDPAIVLPARALARIMPMFVWIADDGRIRLTGPAFDKMAGPTPVIGTSIFDLIEIRRPVPVRDVAGFADLAERRLGLVLRHAPDLALRGILTPLPGGEGYLLDVSLGLSFSKAVAQFGLTLNDFSPCDQTVELLYLFEANTSIRQLSRHLSERLEAARAEAEAQALTDALTGLRNRRAMDLALARCLQDGSEEFALLHIDLDLFKQVNDTYGHAAGDAVLERVGEILRTDLRAADIAGRVGGDEFLVILREHSEATDVGAVATRLIAAIEVPIRFEDVQCRISASIGITSSADYPVRPSADGLLADTDLALYRAKRQGRGRYAVFNDQTVTLPVSRRAEDPKPRPAASAGTAE
jgi:diguanylate cyclase (GGDEF)-like protein